MHAWIMEYYACKDNIVCMTKKKEKFQEFTKSISIVWQMQQKLVDALSKMPNSSTFTIRKMLER